MNKDRFIGLVTELCNICKMPDPMGIVRGGAVVVDGVAFSFMYSEKIDPRYMIVHCDLGDAKRHNAVALYAKLLKKNFFYSAVRGPVYTIEPESNRLVMTQTVTLTDMTGDSLADLLLSLADQAMSWRELPSTDVTSGALAKRASQPRRTSSSAATLSRVASLR